MKRLNLLIRMCVLCVPLSVVALPCDSQNPTGTAETTGACSPAISGNNNQVTINCQGISKQQAAKMTQILNKILANQLDPETVMAKLDEILHAINPNIPAKTYFCNGQWRTAGPGRNAGFEVSLGGDDSIFQEMVRLNNSGQFTELLKLSLSQTESTPEWLTPRLFGALAYLSLGDKLKAKELLKEYDAKTGPAYDVDACHQISAFLHSSPAMK